MRKHFKKRFTAALLALCLVFTMASSVYAADTPQVNIPATATAPAAEQVKTESQLTAEYVLNNTNFSDISDTSKFYNTSRNLILIMRSPELVVSMLLKVMKWEGQLLTTKNVFPVVCVW